VRVALVCPYAWDEPGGVQVQVRGLGERLRARGHEVLALAPARARPAEPWVVRAGVPLSLPYGRTRAPISPWPATRRRVRTALEAFAPDVVHVHEPFAPSASAFALGAGAPVVATFHSGIDRALLYDAAGPLLRRTARRIAVRIAVSERAAAVARRRLGGTFVVIPNGVDAARFAAASPADLGPGTKLLFVGRLHPRKGFAIAVEAFAALAANRPGLRLVVAGEGGEASALDRVPGRVRDRVAMLGAVPNEELPPIHAACDVFVAPNTGGESFGVILLEAMASGLPVVASDIAGFEEVVTPNVDGLLVPPRDPGALATAVERVLDDPVAAARLAEAGRRRAAAADWPVVVERLEAVYAEAVATGSPPLR
jgi:phosphatidyl-myo-inositol alpha-mannosyltransferase